MILFHLWLDAWEFWLNVLLSPAIIVPPSPPPIPRPPSRVIDLAQWRVDHPKAAA